MDSHINKGYKRSLSKDGNDKNSDKKQKVVMTGGKCFLHGFNYELKISTWLLIWRIPERQTFQISKEIKEAGKFDDIIYENIDEQGRHYFWFIQAKHKLDESKKITFLDLVTEDEKGEFQLQKYFKSYLSIEEKFSGMIKYMILCTNIDFEEKIENHIQLDQLPNAIEILNYGNLRPKHKTRKHLQIQELPCQLKEKFQLCSEVYQLAHKLANDIICGNKLELRHELLKKYQFAVENYVLSASCDKKSTNRYVCDNFADNIHLSQRTQTFRAAFLKVGKVLMMKMKKKTKTLPTDIEFWDHIRKVKVELSATFGQTKECESELPNDEITTAQMKIFCQKFVFAVNEPNEREMTLIIKDYFEENYNKTIPDSLFTNEFFQHIWQWMSSDDDTKTTFTNKEKEELVSYLKDNWDKLSIIGNKSDNPEKLLHEGSFFKNISTMDAIFKVKSSIVCLICDNGTSLTYMKVVQYLEKYTGLGMCTLMNLKQAIALQNNLSKILSSEKKFILVIEINSKENCNEAALQFLNKLIPKLEQMVILIISQKNANFNKILDKLNARYSVVHHDNNELKNITNSAQERMLLNDINFQDTNISIKELHPDWQALLPENVLCKIIDNVQITIGRNPESSLNATTPHYLERTFKNHSKIREEDIIDHFRSNYGLAICNVKSKDILPKELLDNQIANIDNFKVQTMYATEKYDAHKQPVAVSSDSIFTIYDVFMNIIQRFPEKKFRFLEIKNKKWSEIIREEDIATKVFTGKLIVISGEPGMGKSMVLMHIAGRIKCTHPLKWVIKVNLVDYSSKLEELSKDIDKIDLDSVIGFLSDAESHSDEIDCELTKSLLYSRIKNDGNVIVLFEGFDEIMPYYGKTVRKMISMMESSRIEQIWITTRPNYHAKFDAVSLTLVPFSRDQQSEYLEKYWSKFATDNDETIYRISQFARNLVFDLYNSTNREIANPMGNALQLQLVAEAFKDECLRFIHTDIDILRYEKTLEFNELYTKFVKEKYNIWLKDKMSCDLSKSCVKNELKSKHRNGRTTLQFYATLQLFPKTNTDLQIIINHCRIEKKLTKEDLCTIGLMLKGGNGKIQFVHRTFAEFYVADMLAMGLGLSSDTFEVDDLFDQMDIEDSDYDDDEMFNSAKSNNVCLNAALDFLRPEYFKENQKMIRVFLDHMIVLNMAVHKDFLTGNSSKIDARLLEFSENPKSIRVRDTLGRTPFHLACLSSINWTQINRMLQMDATLLSLTDALDFGPISYAVASNRDYRLPVIIELLKAGGQDENFKKTLKYFIGNINDFTADFDDEYYDNLTIAINQSNLFAAILDGNDNYIDMFVETFNEKLNRKRVPAIFFVADVKRQHEMLLAIQYEIINFFMSNNKGPSLGTVKDSILKRGEEKELETVKQIKHHISKLPAFNQYFSKSLKNPLHLNAVSTLISLSCKSIRCKIYEREGTNFLNEMMTKNIHFIVFDLLEIFGLELFEQSICNKYFIDFFRDVSIAKAASHAGTPNLDLSESLLQNVIDNLRRDANFMRHFPPGENSFELNIKYYAEPTVSNLQELRLKLHDLWEKHKEGKWPDFYNRMYYKRPQK